MIGGNDALQPSDELFDLSLLDAKEKKKLKKKQRKRDKKIKQQMAQHGLLPPESEGGPQPATGAEDDGIDSAADTDTMNAFQNGFITGQANDANYQEFYENFHKLY